MVGGIVGILFGLRESNKILYRSLSINSPFHIFFILAQIGLASMIVGVFIVNKDSVHLGIWFIVTLFLCCIILGVVVPILAWAKGELALKDFWHAVFILLSSIGIVLTIISLFINNMVLVYIGVCLAFLLLLYSLIVGIVGSILSWAPGSIRKTDS